MVQQRLVRDFYNILNEVKTGEIPSSVKLPDSFEQMVSDMKNNQYDAKTFAFMLKGMVSCMICLH
jgi:alpha-1,4-galacturonosyltransferase